MSKISEHQFDCEETVRLAEEAEQAMRACADRWPDRKRELTRALDTLKAVCAQYGNKNTP